MRTNGRCDCGRAACRCTRPDCTAGCLPDVDSVVRGVTYTTSPPCPDCRPELVEVLTTTHPDDRVKALQDRGVLKRRRRPRTPTQRGPSVYAQAHAEREAARADLR